MEFPHNPYNPHNPQILIIHPTGIGIVISEISGFNGLASSCLKSESKKSGVKSCGSATMANIETFTRDPYRDIAPRQY